MEFKVDFSQYKFLFAKSFDSDKYGRKFLKPNKPW